jgi:hypothetical protein
MESGKWSVGNVVAVVAVLVVLAIVVLPAFATSRRSPCQSNLKQCAQALKMYCDDFDGMMPSSYLIHRSSHWNRQDCIKFCTQLCSGPGANYPGTNRATWSQVLYENMRNKDIMFCTSDLVDRRARDVTVSYWFKPAMDRAWYGCPKPRRRMADYGYESDQIAFFERCGWHYQDQGGLRAPKGGNNVEINASFMDSHVEKIAIPASGPPNYVNSPAGMTRAYAPFYYNCYVDPNTHVEKLYDKGPLPISTKTGKCIDPGKNYDKL